MTETKKSKRDKKRNIEKKIASRPKTLPSDRFMETLRKTLEHIHDPEWLAKNSPLASVFFAGTTVSAERQRQVTLLGLPEIDQQLRSTWHEWESLEKTPLQSLLWASVCQLPTEIEMPLQATLILTYFDIAQPKQSQVIKLLAIGRSTYYRYLERAIEQLAELITRFLRPALRLEIPTARPIVGRTKQIAQAQTLLLSGRVVHLIGGSGLGKTSLAAHLAEEWPHGVFWYTFRPGITDYLEQLLYSIAYFLHNQGESGLWLYLTTNSEPINAGRAILALQEHMENLRERPPLFCFDEVDLLLADELFDSHEHAMLRGFLEEWSATDRSDSPILLIGQKLLLEPDELSLIRLDPFTVDEVGALTDNGRAHFNEEQRKQLIALTRGNPLLLRLFLTLKNQDESITNTIDTLTEPISLDWFLIRIVKHLTTKEHVLLYELSVFPDSAPQDGWVRTRKQLDSLIRLGLLEPLSNGGITLHPALRKLIYDQLPPARRCELHLAAGNLLAERSQFTAAARHYLAGERPELAIWTWYNHSEQEIEQGQSNAALDLFSKIESQSLPRVEDQQALALLLGPLMVRAGRYREGLSQMDHNSWRENTVSSVLAHEVRGELYAKVGEIDHSIAEFRKGLNALGRIRSTHESELQLKIAGGSFTYLRDVEKVTEELDAAETMLQIARGNVARVTGDYAAAKQHYDEALAVAEKANNISRLAMLNTNLGILAARQGNLNEAIACYKNAGRYFEASGNVVPAIGATNSGIAFVYLQHHRYEDAIAPAEKSLAFYRELGEVYWIAINETYLAEAWLYLDDLARAERYAHSALAQEEVAVRPYCLFLLGHVRRRQARFADAERYCREAIEIASEFQNPGALAPAWSALGETLRDAAAHGSAPQDSDQCEEAVAAFEKALGYWQQIDNQLEIDQTKSLLNELLEQTSAKNKTKDAISLHPS